MVDGRGKLFHTPDGIEPRHVYDYNNAGLMALALWFMPVFENKQGTVYTAVLILRDGVTFKSHIIELPPAFGDRMIAATSLESGIAGLTQFTVKEFAKRIAK
jgi:hypothetical protein